MDGLKIQRWFLSIGIIFTLICLGVMVNIQELGDSILGGIFCHTLQKYKKVWLVNFFNPTDDHLLNIVFILADLYLQSSSLSLAVAL